MHAYDDQNELESCMGCRALVPKLAGRPHRYIGASSGCWTIFGEVLAREYGEYRHPASPRLTVDTYAAQHPGASSPQSIRSIAIHLISLYLELEMGLDTSSTMHAMQKAARHSNAFYWLEPPFPRGEWTILYVREAEDMHDHAKRVQQWASSVWASWRPHHDTIREWAGYHPG